MQTDMSPIDDSYDPIPPPQAMPPQGRVQFFDDEPPMYHRPPSQPHYFAAQQSSFLPQHPIEKGGFFAQFDTVTWVVIGLLVLIAFFMGKTMQPVILKA
jgi:hypothetical protein